MNQIHLDRSMRLLFGEGAFVRADERADKIFYSRERLVPHLDDCALASVEELIATLVVEARPAILDLMASWDSHIPASMQPSRMVGLGLNAHELDRNPLLSERVIHDLNVDPRLPFEDDCFDAVLNTVSVDYLIHPFEVFAEAARVLKPGGVHLVIFSNRMFSDKAVKVWLQAGEEERLWIVEDFFRANSAYEKTTSFSVRGKPRPATDKYCGVLSWSDPIYAVWAEKRGADPKKSPRPMPVHESAAPAPEEIERRKQKVRETLLCPYCEEPLTRWVIANEPFCEWPNEFVHVCLNNGCSYFVDGFDAMGRQGNHGYSYRLMYDADRDTFGPTAIPCSSSAGVKAAQFDE